MYLFREVWRPVCTFSPQNIIRVDTRQPRGNGQSHLHVDTLQAQIIFYNQISKVLLEV